MFEPLCIFTNVTKFACPRSRRITTSRRELLEPPPDESALRVRCHGCVQSEAAVAFPGTGEDPSEETGQSIRPAAEKRTLSAAEMIGPELTNALSLWAQLVLQQIRPHVRSCQRVEQDAGNPPQNRRRPASEAHSSRTGSAGLQPPEDTILPAIETLFVQLAERRLSHGVNQETRQ